MAPVCRVWQDQTSELLLRRQICGIARKGMWMGGTIPLGYDVEDRKLVTNAEEADASV